MNFKKNKEDFKCEHCSSEVKGSGYTNHCPNCLWSKHVDINPGDRACECSGMMKPKSYEKNGEDVSITHECVKCGYKKKNKISPEDDFDKVISLI